MIHQASFIEQANTSRTSKILSLPEAMANRVLTDRLFANKLTEQEKTTLADRLVARAFINDAIKLNLSPQRVYSSVQANGNAINQARELIKRYFYCGENDPRGIAKPDSNPASVSGTYRNLYQAALETLSIQNPVSYQRQAERTINDFSEGVPPCRYASFYKAAAEVAPSTNPETQRTMRKLITRYFPNVSQAEEKEKLMGQFKHLINAAKRRGAKSNAKLSG